MPFVLGDFDLVYYCYRNTGGELAVTTIRKTREAVRRCILSQHGSYKTRLPRGGKIVRVAVREIRS